RNAAGSNDGEGGAFEHFLCAFDVWSFQYAIARNVRVDHQTSAYIVESLRERNCPDVGIFSPTGHPDTSIEGVNPDSDIVRLLGHSLFDEVDILNGSRSEDYALYSGVQQGLNDRHASDSTARLNLGERHCRRHFAQQ